MHRRPFASVYERQVGRHNTVANFGEESTGEFVQ